ncbi:MAG: DegT/DnrJ/EryC1/StrS aminotransferase family protein [Lachnospiraceae bacterium]|nr:DegT/DnrJ/EryC1/StrS aminotransferase family protein [Lachnospiraceae bacterium]
MELNNGCEYFDCLPEEYITRYNSGTTAIYAAILSLNVKRIWVPYFYCPSVWEMFKSDLLSDYTFIPYYVDENLLPRDITQDSDAIILVNYYGVMNDKIFKYIKDKKNIIIDNAQAYFCPPIMQDRILNVYSCRKFVGVNDGAYLIGIHQKKFDFEQSYSSDSLGHICKSIEYGTNSVYHEQATNDSKLNKEFKLMSVLTTAILKNTNYNNIKEKRNRNFNFIHEYMKKYQELKIDLSSPIYAYCYPLLLKKDIRMKLIKQKIYIPTLWKELISSEFAGLIEYNLSANCLCLPIDQRYDIEDMKYICDTIIDLLKEEN